jgi:hypothetical protein
LDLPDIDDANPIIAMKRRRIPSENKTGLILVVFAVAGLFVFSASSWFSSKLFPTQSEADELWLSAELEALNSPAPDDQLTETVIDEPESDDATVLAEAGFDGDSGDGLMDVVTKSAIDSSFSLTAASEEIFISTSEVLALEIVLQIPVYNPDDSVSAIIPPAPPSFLKVIDVDDQPKLVELTSGPYQVAITEPLPLATPSDAEPTLAMTAAGESEPSLTTRGTLSLGILHTQGIILNSSYSLFENVFDRRQDYVKLSSDGFKTVLATMVAAKQTPVPPPVQTAPSEAVNNAATSISISISPHKHKARLNTGAPEPSCCNAGSTPRRCWPPCRTNASPSPTWRPR